MGSLFGNMTKRGSYGVVPGNGNPKADDKTMNAGPGHVVPHENVDAAKKIVAALGYNPDQKVSMNQGGSDGQTIKISSKEYFLNDEQVDRMKTELDIDPETLSPNSPYNERVKGGTTKQVDDMVDDKLSMYSLMMNNNNQYPAYQNGGGTPGPTYVDDKIPGVYNQYNLDEFDAIDWSTVGGSWAGFADNREEGSGYDLMRKGIEKGSMGFDLRNPEAPVHYYTMKDLDPFKDAMARLEPKPLEPLPEDTFTNRNNYPGGRFPEYHELYDPEIDADPTDPRDTSEFAGESPEDKALSDLMQRSQDLTKNEKLANVGMALWNLGREYKDLPEPIRVRPSSTRMDYEQMKADAEKDISEQAALSHYINKQMGGSPVGTTGITANQMSAQNEISSSIHGIAQQIMNQDAAREDQYASTWLGQKTQRDMQNAAMEGAFAADKGDKIAGNIREIYDSEEAGLYRDQGLLSAKSSKDMDAMYMDYKSLNKEKMMAGKDPNNPKSGYLSFEDYTKMTPEERRQLGELYS